MDTLERLDPLFVVMGAYGRSKVAELFLGSTTAHVLNELSVPLFLFQ